MKIRHGQKDDLKPNPSTSAEEKFSQIPSRISSLAESFAHVLLELQNVVSLSDEQYLHLLVRIGALDLGSREGISSDISNFWRNRGKDDEKASKLVEEFEYCEVLQRSCRQMLKDKKG